MLSIHECFSTCTACYSIDVILVRSTLSPIQGIPVILVITGVSLMILDPKHLTLKYRIELQYVKQLSMSSFSDQIFVVHIDPVSLTLPTVFLS